MAATRVTVTLPEDLAAEMDRSAENRSFFIARAVRAELKRQREFLQPLPTVSTDTGDWGFREWDSMTSEEDLSDTP